MGPNTSFGMGIFEQAYQDGPPPWEIGRPQPAFVALEEAGEIVGDVLDVGCGTGENALYLANRGHEVWGVDGVPAAIERARQKAAERGPPRRSWSRTSWTSPRSAAPSRR